MERTELPQLKGTAKQIEWANNIRYKAILNYGDRAWDLIAKVKTAATWIKHKDEISKFLQLADFEHPRRLTLNELEGLDISKLTKAEIHEMWLIDKLLYQQQVEIPWEMLLSIEANVPESPVERLD